MATKRSVDEVWVCRDGRELPVGKLSEEHAKSILRMLIRKRRVEANLVELLAVALRPVLKRLDQKAEETQFKRDQDMEDEFWAYETQTRSN